LACRSFRFWGGQGELQRKLAELPRFAPYRDAATAVSDDPVANAEPEASTTADVLGGKEGVENTVQDFGGYSGAVVAEVEPTDRVCLRGPGPDEGGFSGGVFPGADGIGRVLEQVDEDLNQAVAVRADGDAVGDVGFEADFVAHFGGEEAGGGGDGGGDLDVILGGAGVGEGAEVADDGDDAVEAVADILDRFLEFGVKG
jgi:hypothetical protein